MRVFTSNFESPIGPMELVCTDKGLIRVEFVERGGEPGDPHQLLDECERQLDEYFRGRRTAFTVPLDPAGTLFQLGVWKALADLPYGSTTHYQELATRLGKATGARAVGSAVAKNRLAIMVPCHRVIGKDGDLTGFAWGTWRKEWLLRHEQGNLLEYHI